MIASKNNKPIRIAIILPSHWSINMGGAEYQVKCLVNKLIKTEHFDIFYLTRLYDRSELSNQYKLVRIAAANGIRRYGFFFDTIHLLKLLYKIDPDIIYQRVGSAYTGIAAFFASNKKNCTMVWHISSDMDVNPLFEKISFRSAIRHIDKKILEFGIKNCHKIIAQTNQQAKLLRENYNRIPIKIIPNFHTIPTKINVKARPIKIVWIANMKPIKQPEVFLKLAEDLINYGTKVECIMIGAPFPNQSKWKLVIEKKIRNIHNLNYLGALPIEQVNNILSKAHILVNTSLIEGLPNTFIQSWMRYVPVVSLHSNPDGVLTKQKIGFCTHTYDKMLQKVVELIEKPLLLHALSKNAYEYSTTKYSNKNAETLVRVLYDAASIQKNDII